MEKEIILQKIKEIIDKNGRCTVKELEDSGIKYSETLKYGGYSKLLNELGYKRNTRLSPYTKEEIIEDFLRVYKKYGKIGKEFYIEHGKYSIQTIRTNFGSLNNLMKICGIKVNMHKKVTKDEVKESVKRFIEETGSRSSTEYRKRKEYVEGTINSLFGSWGNLLREIGETPMVTTKTLEEMEEEAKNLYQKYGVISYRMVRENCDFTFQAIMYHYNSLEEVENKLGIKFNNSLSVNEEILFYILREIFGEENIKREATFGWLVNPQTNRKLRVDFLIEKEKLIIEYDGKQHYIFNEQMHQTKERFNSSKNRDIIKNILIPQHGYKLVRITYNDRLTRESVEEILRTNS